MWHERKIKEREKRRAKSEIDRVGGRLDRSVGQQPLSVVLVYEHIHIIPLPGLSYGACTSFFPSYSVLVHVVFDVSL